MDKQGAGMTIGRQGAGTTMGRQVARIISHGISGVSQVQEGFRVV